MKRHMSCRYRLGWWLIKANLWIVWVISSIDWALSSEADDWRALDKEQYHQAA